MKKNSGGKDILITLPSFPFPLRRDGRSVRYLPIIQHLSENHNVDLLVITQDDDNKNPMEELLKVCRRVIPISVPSPKGFGLMRKGGTWIKNFMPWSPPYIFVKHGGEKISRQIVKNLEGRRYDIFIWVTGEYTPYLLDINKKIHAEKIIVDFIDSPSLWAKRELEKKRNFSLSSWCRYWKMVRWEGKVSRKASEVVYISPIDAAAVPEKYTGGTPRHVVNNGINVENYHGGELTEIPHPNIGFLGNMGYGPNIEAVTWLYDKVFLPLKNVVPGLNLIIIGRNPKGAVKDLGKREGVIVTGEVEDIWPFVHSVDIFAFPIWMGTGIKNKVLEAMYSEKPVITTPVGNDGIGGISGDHLFICHSAEEFQKEIIGLLNSEKGRKELGLKGHAHVNEKFCWDLKLEEFEKILLK